MSDHAEDEREFVEKAWKVLNLQADTMLKMSQNRTDVWKVVIAGMTAGAAFVAAGAALVKIFSP